MPGLKLIAVGSKKDLKPTKSRLLRRMPPSPPPLHHLLRLVHERHPGLLRRLSAFTPVAAMTGAHYVLPCRKSAARARNHVVEVEFRARQSLAAVLAGVVIPRIDVEARKTHVALGDALV